MDSSIINATKAVFAAGCFWGVEQSFQNQKGVVATTVGFTGGMTENPTYREVCTGNTGHVEAVEIVFNPAVTAFESLAKHFFQIHNPALISNTTGKRSQYRSVIFYLTKEQKEMGLLLMGQLREKGVDVATEIIPAAKFYKAEESHQRYYEKKGKVYHSGRYKPRW